VLPISTTASPYYAPENWMPHISLAYTDVTRQNLPCLMDKLAFRPVYWQVEIDNISFIYEPNGVVGEKRFEYKFGAKENDPLGNR